MLLNIFVVVHVMLCHVFSLSKLELAAN